MGVNQAAPTLDALLAGGDYEQIECVRDRSSGLQACIVLDDTRLGPAFGGIRCRPYPSFAAALADAMALARAMTLKCALAGLPAGGGKGVVLDHEGLDRDAAFARLGRHVQAMGGRFFTGPDVGTGTRELRALARGTRFVAHPEGDAGDIARPTAVGVRAAIDATAHHLGLALRGLRVAIQGVGAVGANLARLLAADGASLALADIDGERVRAVAAATGARIVAPETILATACDVLAPCALEQVITAENAPRIRARMICEGANGPTTPAADEILEDRGVLVLPDVLANAGGVVVSYFEWVQGLQEYFWKEYEVNAKLNDITVRAFEETWQTRERFATSMRMAAYGLAVQRVAEATTIRGLYP